MEGFVWIVCVLRIFQRIKKIIFEKFIKSEEVKRRKSELIEVNKD